MVIVYHLRYKDEFLMLCFMQLIYGLWTIQFIFIYIKHLSGNDINVSMTVLSVPYTKP